VGFFEKLKEGLAKPIKVCREDRPNLFGEKVD
jgi:hypothetical protein